MGAPELENVNDLLRELQARFEDSFQSQEVKAEIKLIRQKRHPAKEVVQEFHCQTGKLRNWPERNLVHYFKEYINEELLKNMPVPRSARSNP